MSSYKLTIEERKARRESSELQVVYNARKQIMDKRNGRSIHKQAYNRARQ